MRREFSAFFLALVLSALTVQAGALPDACGDLFLSNPGPRQGTVSVKNLKSAASSNPLIADSKLPFGTFDFAAIKVEDIKPAYEHAIAQAEARLKAIVDNKEAPTFSNTIEAIESYDLPLERVQNILGHYQNVKKTDAISALSKELEPRISTLDNSVSFNEALFERVKAVRNNVDQLNLTPEQRRLVGSVYGRFVSAGVTLSETTKKRIDVIDGRLSILATEFRDHMTEDQAAYAFEISNEADLKGLPTEDIEHAKQKAEKAGRPGVWLFGYSEARSSLLGGSPNSAIREAVWRDLGKVAAGNKQRVVEIAKLREERAKLLGSSTHAERILAGRMAKNTETVFEFLEKLKSTYLPAAKSELDEVERFAGKKLEPWDLTYYSAKLKKERFGFSPSEVKPYLELGNVLKGFFYVAHQLHGVTFESRPDLPTWDPEVRAFEVKDRNGQHLALFYVDPFAREGEKRAGAWMDDLQKAGLADGVSRRPIVINVMNIKPPVKGQPALLTFDDVTTVFHEGGHALHSILTQTHYRRYAGTSVAWDFVELPSQFMENYVFEPKVLSVFARHYQTGAPMPRQLLKRAKDAETFQAGFAGLRQLRLATLDMAWHAQDLSAINDPADVDAHEISALKQFELIASRGGPLSATTFSHIFAGGYSAGYYSYKWADVLASDAFEAFKETSIFDPKTAASFRTSILERGGTVDADQMYRDFRKRDPDPEALLRKEGLLPPKN